MFAPLLVLAALGRTAVKADSFDEGTFNQVVTKLENDAFELAAEVERLYEKRCDVDTMNSCRNANFGECQKDYPLQECLDGPSFIIDGCSSRDSACSGLWSFGISNIRYPEDKANGVHGNPTDPSLVESICFTRTLDDWFIKKYQTDKAYWDDLGVEPRSMYFGSHTSAFRIFPARQSKQCGVYDPTLRPWYVAGSSGPKNIVLILDVSGSMDHKNRLNMLKQAAKRVVSTLTVSDRVLLIPFSTTAEAITDNGFVFKTTDANKAKLIESIDQLQARGSTNYYEGFQKAFDAVEASAKNEYTAGCNTAILFLTDGENTDGPGLEEVFNLVSTRIAKLSDMLSKPVFLFTYSVSESNDDAAHVYPRLLACSVELGVWSKITNSDEILDALSNYYRLFALGLGSGSNEGFAAWVEPYQFATGNVWGTTVSVPVFDRSKTPHLFLGVVGIDIALDALDAALAKKDAASVVPGSTRAEELRAESIKQIVIASEASCPHLNLSACQMEAYRSLSATGNEGLCGANCSGIEITQVQAEKCSAVSDYPTTLFAESIEKVLSYTARVCCLVGQTTASNSCYKESEGPSIGIIVGTVVGGVAGVCIGVYFWFFFKKRSRKNATNKQVPSKSGESQMINDNSTQNTSPTNPVWVASPAPPLEFASAPCVPPSEPSEADDSDTDDE